MTMIDSKPTFLVSIIIPIFNAEKYLERAVLSLLSQTYKYIEILCIDDGSTDNSLDILNKLQIKNPGMKIIKKKNSGVSATRNKGIELATGDFLFFCDADDWIEPYLIETLINSFKNNPESDIFICGFCKEYNNSSTEELVFNKQKRLGKKELGDYLIKYTYKPNRNSLFISVWGRLIKSEVIHSSKVRFSEELSTFEDVLFNFELLKNTENVAYVPVLGYHYTIHQNYNSTSMSFSKKENDLFGFVKAIHALEKILVNNLEVPIILAHSATSHALVSYTIIQTIRLCRTLSFNKYLFIKSLVKSSWLRESFEHYRPTGSDSKIIPILFKYKLSLLIMILSYNKFNNRYKKF